MDDLTAIEDKSDDSREFIGNAHTVTISPTGVTIAGATADQPYLVPLKQFREVLEDWEAFILDDVLDDELGDDEYL